MKTDRGELTNRIYKKLDGTLSKLVIYDAIQTICDVLEDSIAAGQSISIKNFGTFHKYEYLSRKTVDVNSGELRDTRTFVSVRFVPDETLSTLINQRKSFFKRSN